MYERASEPQRLCLVRYRRSICLRLPLLLLLLLLLLYILCVCEIMPDGMRPSRYKNKQDRLKGIVEKFDTAYPEGVDFTPTANYGYV